VPRCLGDYRSSTNPGVVALALGGAAEVVDDDAGSPAAEKGGIGLAQAAAGTGDDDHLAVEAQLSSHYFILWGVLLLAVRCGREGGREGGRGAGRRLEILEEMIESWREVRSVVDRVLFLIEAGGVGKGIEKRTKLVKEAIKKKARLRPDLTARRLRR
jgi:hypothetical protein